MAYARFLVRRLLQAVPVLIGITFLVFLLIHLAPGDPARSALGSRATPEAIANLHHEWGLDRSLPAQYLDFLKRLVSGDLGTSLRYGQSAGKVIFQVMPATLWLIVYSMVLTVLISVPMALLAASRPGAIRDRVISVLSISGLSIPGFWLGLILVEYVAVRAQLLPASGFGEGIGGHLESLFLPSLTIAVGIVPLLVRSLRAELLRVEGSDYVVTARAKGLSEARIRLRHVLRNALAPSVTLLALMTSFLLGGTVVVENVFGIGGVGDLMLKAINNRDFPMVQAITLVLAFFVVIVNILGDLTQALIDPRVEAR
jgi:peptide/nickel transport system permease protein